MNDPSVHDVLAGSLDRHGRAVGTPEGDLGDVLRRVDRRRARRRSAAVIGSTLAVGAGAAGIMLLASPAEAPAPGDGNPDAAAAGSWGCTGFLSFDGSADYYEMCEAFPTVVTPTAPLVAPATAPPTTSGWGTTVPPLATTTGPVMMPPVVMTTLPPVRAEHTVAAGQSVYWIADLYGVDPVTLAEYNGWPEGINHMLEIGDIVLVPDLFTVVPTTASTTSPVWAIPPVCETDAGATRVSVPCEAPPSYLAPVPSATTIAPLSVPGTAFRCTGPLGGDPAYSYYLSCETVPVDAVPPMPSTPTTVTILPPFATTAPPTTPPMLPPATAAPLPSSPGLTAPVEQTYTVVAGDSLTTIAELYGIDVRTLVNYNAWPEGIEHPLFVGDTVRIPPNARIP
jgi:hypothetical protein